MQPGDRFNQSTTLPDADGGTIQPGNGIGTLSLNNLLTLGSGVTLDYQLDAGDQAGGSGINDLIDTVTDLTLDGTLNVNSSPLSDGTWRLINYSGTLTDNTLDLGSIFLASGHQAAIDTGTVGQVNLVVTSISEPASAALLAMGGLVLLDRRRRVA